MSISLKFQVCLAFLFCFMWQNTYSQLLYQKNYKEVEYLPPYDPNVVIINPQLKKWIDEELVKVSEKRTIEMKTDVLGRTKPNANITVQGTKEIELKQVAEPKQKRLVRISEMRPLDIKIEPMHGGFEYNPETKDYDYHLNGKNVSLKEYETLTKKYYEKIDRQKANTSKRKLPIPGVVSDDELGWTALMTAEEISTLTNNYKELAIEDHREVVEGAGTDISSILSKIQLSTLGHYNGYDGDGVGIYVAEAKCIASSPPLVNSSNYRGGCSSLFATSSHHNKVVNVLQSTAPNARISAYFSNMHPENPHDFSPPIEIGSHSYMSVLDSITAGEAMKYKDSDFAMDKYIYDNQMINFVCVGNKSKTLTSCGASRCDTTSYVASPGKAVNAITVGAVHSSGGDYPNRYTWYSQWKPSKVGNRKPEIAMYTDINLGMYSSYTSFDGCSAATPLAAGFTASLLERFPGYKRQPALVKAALMVSEKIPILNADSIVSATRGFIAKGIANFPSEDTIGRKLWNGENSDYFINDTITFMWSSNVQANKHYKIAIAWLTEPSYTNSYNKMSQDLDLFVYQNGQLLDSSTSPDNPFEIVDVVPPSNAPLKIIIRRYRNNGGKVLLGYAINRIN